MFVGQQRIAGASTHYNAAQATRGSVWVSILPARLQVASGASLRCHNFTQRSICNANCIGYW